jgi:uncharacterized Tic20 family protein
MRCFFILFGREVSSAFHQPLAYVVMCFFLVVTGFNFHAGVSLLNHSSGTTTMVEAFFNTVYFWIPLALVFPLITLFLTVLSFSQLGEGLKDRFDPVLR